MSATYKMIFLSIFFMIAILDVFGVVTNNELLQLISKPLLIVLLLLAYLVSKVSINKWYILALFFALIGDIFSVYSGKINFLYGLISFTLVYISFIFLVKKLLNKSNTDNILLSIIVFLGLYLIILLIFRDLGMLQIPVIIYGFVILTFGRMAFNYYLNQKSKVSKLLFIAALFFIASDSMLALYKFYAIIDYLNVIATSTYIVAQFLIFRAMISLENQDVNLKIF